MTDVHLPDLTDHRAAQLILQLQHVTQTLAAVWQHTEVFDLILHDALEALGGIAGTVLLVQGEGLHVVARRGHDTASVWQDGDLAGQRPGTDALRLNTPLYFSQEGDLAAAYPELEAQTGGVAAVASAVIPLTEGARPLGVIMLDFRAPHDFTPDERHFLLTLAAQCTIALERARLSGDLERQVEERTRQIEEEARTQEAFVAFTESVGSETDVLALCHKSFEVMDTRFDEYSSAYYEVQGGLWKALAWTTEMTAEQIGMIRAGLPLDVPSFAQALETKQPVFIDGWDAEREKIENTDVFGPVCIYPLLVKEEVRGLFTVGLRVGVQWQNRDRALMRAFGRSLTLALERTETARQLTLQNAELQARTQALEAFTRLTEAVGSQTDVQVLVRQAITLLHETCDVDVIYVEREEALFKTTAWNPEFDLTLLPLLRHGFPLQHSGIGKVLRQNTAAFIDHWNDTGLLFEESGIFQAVAGYPYFVAGQLESVLMAGTRSSATWAERDKGIFRAVGRSLDLALERAATAQHLEEKNAELYAQTLALEGVAELTRDLTLPGGQGQLIEQVMDLVLSLLPHGYAAFWERRGGHWQVMTQRGDVERPEWQATRARGFPIGQFPTLDRPWQTRQPYFQDNYNPSQDGVPLLMDHLLSTATLPVLVNGEAVGVFAVALFGHRRWSAADRALMETGVHSLGVALERAAQARALTAQRDMLQASNEELEAFTYSVSHDLRTPVRHILSFGGLLRRSLPEPISEKTARYLGIVEDGARQLNELIDGILELSRTSRKELKSQAIDLNQLVLSVRQEVEPTAAGRKIAWQVAELPHVAGDPVLLRQVLNALLGNAVKFTRTREQALIEIWGEERQHHWAVLVRDNGVGFDPRYQDKLFSMFQRLHRQEDFEGAGVSLATVRRIITRHGGMMTTEGQVDQGATFGFTLPKTKG